jgi:RND superfamily putative drug exporter
MDIPGMRIELGGQPVYYNDFDVAMKAAYGRSIGFVLFITCLVLLLVFRAPLVAVKALVLNALSVLAGYGVVVWVFQQGHGSAWLGVSGPTGVVPLTIPLLIFCILFGLSMDYEVFLLSRARAAFQRTGDNTASVREALADTGSVITSAALIMVAVFGAFAFARVVLVQMLGVGLAAAVLVDATVIRCLLGPALMRVAGGWNWWPLAANPSDL